jgi:metal-sulfur cluster biosynthetic enzyme
MADQETILAALKTVIDPELGINVVDLGLVYTVQSREDQVDVEMTLTTPACPAGPEILRNAVTAVEKVEGVTKANVKLVMSPPWSPGPDDGRGSRRAGDLLNRPARHPDRPAELPPTSPARCPDRSLATKDRGRTTLPAPGGSGLRPTAGGVFTLGWRPIITALLNLAAKFH